MPRVRERGSARTWTHCARRGHFGAALEEAAPGQATGRPHKRATPGRTVEGPRAGEREGEGGRERGGEAHLGIWRSAATVHRITPRAREVEERWKRGRGRLLRRKRKWDREERGRAWGGEALGWGCCAGKENESNAWIRWLSEKKNYTPKFRALHRRSHTTAIPPLTVGGRPHCAIIGMVSPTLFSMSCTACRLVLGWGLVTWGRSGVSPACFCCYSRVTVFGWPVWEREMGVNHWPLIGKSMCEIRC
jgi:hypothetical protein